ncbi:MAG: cyclic nucleotide-binding domain-containing protein [Anaerolineales bacterium]|nr:cyclic nucleotide-binding domain-containing protein [Anaerolineales bacterium]
MEQSIATILALAEMFDNLTKTQLELIAAIAEPATYDAGHVLIHENEDTDELYVIAEGAIEILVNPAMVADDQRARESVVVAELHPGQVFGEVALVDQGIRSATARVSRPKTRVLRISRKRLMLLCDSYPELGYKVMRNLAADLALKIRQTDLTLRQYQLLLTKGGI